MPEVWKPMPRWEALYEVSDRGSVRSRDRVTLMRNGRSRAKRGRTLKTWLTGPGYPTVRLYDAPGRAEQMMVHRAVALTFLPIVEGKPNVNHKNGVKTDNRVENLEWSTYSENALHAYATGLMCCPDRRGSRQPSSVLTEGIVAAMRSEYAPRRVSYAKLARKYGVTPITARRAIVGISWAHVSTPPRTPKPPIHEHGFQRKAS